MISKILGNYLISKGKITSEQLDDVIEEITRVRVKLGLIAVAEGMITQEQADEMRNRIFQCKSYHSALSIIGDYVNITSAHQEECMDMEME